MTRLVTIVSGGLDSITLGYDLHIQGHEQRWLSFDYGQRHRKELTWAAHHALALGIPHHILPITWLAALLPGSSQTDPAIAVPEGHYAAETMKATIVPNRNAIMLNLAAGIAAAHGVSTLALAVHGGDHFIYPDCRPDFLAAQQATLRLALGDPTFTLLAPYSTGDKTDIALVAKALAVPVHETWSCYQGGPVHCGACGTCVERREALTLAGVHDRTVYAS